MDVDCVQNANFVGPSVTKLCFLVVLPCCISLSCFFAAYAVRELTRRRITSSFVRYTFYTPLCEINVHFRLE
jgi:hypothetical protein